MIGAVPLPARGETVPETLRPPSVLRPLPHPPSPDTLRPATVKPYGSPLICLVWWAKGGYTPARGLADPVHVGRSSASDSAAANDTDGANAAASSICRPK